MYVIKNLDWTEIIERMKNFATSSSAREELDQLGPLKNSRVAEKSFYDIESATFVIQSGVRPHMESLDLFEPWISRLRKSAVLKTLELKDIRHFCLETIALKEALSEQSTAWAVDCSELLMNANEPLSAIDHLMTPSCDIRMDASETLYRLSREKETLARQIQTQMDRLVADHKMDHMLQEKYVTTREGRWVIPVRGGMQHYVPGVIHASSHTKQTVFIEPEVVIPMNNRLRQIDVEIDEEIERLLVEISNYLMSQKNNFEKSKTVLLNCDIQIAKAQLTVLLGAEPCRFSDINIPNQRNDDPIIEMNLKGLFHPILKMNGKKPVSNTVHLVTSKSILLLSGPNAGGKTVLLKAIGLAAQMARCGLPICAEKNSVLPFFDTISTSIGDSQSVDEDLSTFAAHLKTLDMAQKLSGFNNLILVDEICGSTDPEEGSALARAFIETYAENKVFAVVTSHLSPLKSGWKSEDAVVNGSLEYDTQTGKPTYQFLHGIPGDSLAILTARRVGVSENVLKKAHEYLSPLAKQKISALTEIENLKKDLSDLQNKYRKDLKALENAKESLAQQMKNFEKSKEIELEKTIQRASKKVDDEIAITLASSALEKHRKLQEIKYNMPEIIRGPKVEANQNSVQIKNADDFSARFPPGTKVFVQTLNQDGIIQSTPNTKGEVMILSQSIRLQLHYTELKPAQKSSNPTSQLVTRSGTSYGGGTSFLNEDRIVDLRGKTVTVALEDLETALDQAILQKEDRIKLIHGHGTEALKKAIRTFLSRSVYVKKWKAGNSESGGDGVTWVELGLS
jgi:DNA mismatch repair protein MutS2